MLDSFPSLGARVSVLEERVDTVEEMGEKMGTKVDQILFAILGLLASVIVGLGLEVLSLLTAR